MIKRGEYHVPHGLGKPSRAYRDAPNPKPVNLSIPKNAGVDPKRRSKVFQHTNYPGGDGYPV